MKKAVLLVGHGSRYDEANEALLLLRDLVARQRPGALVVHCFMQFSHPDMRDALAKLDEAGVNEVTVMPVFLYAGVHIQKDIPEILMEEADKRPHMRLILAPVLGVDERMAEMIWDRVDGAPKL